MSDRSNNSDSRSGKSSRQLDYRVEQLQSDVYSSLRHYSFYQAALTGELQIPPKPNKGLDTTLARAILLEAQTTAITPTILVPARTRSPGIAMSAQALLSCPSQGKSLELSTIRRIMTRE
jgi:hypothetical protein